MNILTATSTTAIIELAVSRAKHEHGLIHSDISHALGVRAVNIISMWKKDPATGIPLNQILPFSKLTHMHHAEILHFIAVRLDELNGFGTTIDTQAIVMLMQEYAKLSEEEEAVVTVLREEKKLINWNEPVFTNNPGEEKDGNLVKLRAFMKNTIQDEAKQAAAEAAT